MLGIEFRRISDEQSESHGVRELVTALVREIYFAEVILDGMNSVIKGGNKLPHSNFRPKRLTLKQKDKFI